MKYKSTLLLLIAVIIAALVAYSLSRKPTSEELAQQQSRLLPGLKAGDVVKVEIESGGSKIVCERPATDTSRWLITEPLHLRADRWEVEGIVDRFETARLAGRPIQPINEKDLADYGLAEPQGKATFHSAAPPGRTWTVLVGKETGVGDLVFVATAHRKAVYSVEKGVVDKVAVTVNDLRSKHLTDEIRLEDLTGVEITATRWDDRDAVQLTCKKAEGAWELSERVRDMADSKAVEKLAEKLGEHNLSRTDFVVDDPTKAGDYGLDKPDLSLTFQLGEARRTFVFSRKKEADQEVFYAMNKAEPAIVKVTRGLFEDLRKGPEDLRLRSLAQFQKDDAQSITVTHAQASLTLARRNGEWQVAGEEPEPADEPAVDGLLEGLSKATVKGVAVGEPAQPADYGLDAGALWKVVIKGPGERVLADVEFGSEGTEAETVYVRRASYPPVLAVGAGPCVRDIKRGRLAFLSRLMAKEPEAHAIRINLVNKQGEFECAREDAEGDWKLTKPVEGRVDESAVGALLQKFANLRAEGLAAESASDVTPYGLHAPQITAEITYSEPADAKGTEAPRKTHGRHLLVGDQASEDPCGFFARLEGDARVFVLSQDVVDALEAHLASKLICEADGIEKLQFDWDGGALSLAYDKEAHAWKDASGQPVPDQVRQDAERAARVLTRLVGTRVAACIEKDPSAYGFDRPALTVQVKDKAAEGKTVTLGKETEGGRYAKGPASSFVLVAGKEDADALLALAKAPAEQQPAAQP